MATGLKLYVDFMSPPSRALYIVLKQTGIPFEKILVDLAKGEQLTSQFKQVNRFQKVPCITDGDFKLAESVAIFRYLSSTNPVFDKLGGGNDQRRTRVEECLQWQYTLRRGILNFFHLDFLTPFKTGKPSPKDEVHKARTDLEGVLEIVEKSWLDSSKFLIGDEMTVADIFGASDVQQTMVSKYDLGEKYPKIAEWIENVRQETNPHFDDAHKVLYKVANK